MPSPPTRVLLFAAAALGAPALGAVPHQETESPHHTGPGKLSGWTLKTRLPQDDGGALAPTTLVIARDHHVLRKIEGDSFIWAWMFQAAGTQVAFESGPLHFSLTCRLLDLKSGRELASYDCWRELPPDAPAWVKQLEDGSSALHD